MLELCLQSPCVQLCGCNHCVSAVFEESPTNAELYVFIYFYLENVW